MVYYQSIGCPRARRVNGPAAWKKSEKTGGPAGESQENKTTGIAAWRKTMIPVEGSRSAAAPFP
jgi:hypothetical protein